MKQVNRLLGRAMFRQEQELPFGKITAFTDGNSGWMATPQGVMNMPAEVLHQAQGELFRNILALAFAHQDASKTVNAVGDNAVEVSGIGQSAKLEFDPATGLIAKITYKEGPGEVEETLADWRETGGIRMPFKFTVEQNGNKVADASVTEYRFNTGITAEELGKKP